MCSLTQLTCVSQLWPSTMTQSSVHTHPHTTSLHVRVVGDQHAIHVLLRVRYCSQSPPRVSLSLCVSHNNKEFIQTTLGLVLRLVDLVHCHVTAQSHSPELPVREKERSLLCSYSSPPHEVSLAEQELIHSGLIDNRASASLLFQEIDYHWTRLRLLLPKGVDQSARTP